MSEDDRNVFSVVSPGQYEDPSDGAATSCSHKESTISSRRLHYDDTELADNISEAFRDMPEHAHHCIRNHSPDVTGVMPCGEDCVLGVFCDNFYVPLRVHFDFRAFDERWQADGFDEDCHRLIDGLDLDANDFQDESTSQDKTEGGNTSVLDSRNESVIEDVKEPDDKEDDATYRQYDLEDEEEDYYDDEDQAKQHMPREWGDNGDRTELECEENCSTERSSDESRSSSKSSEEEEQDRSDLLKSIDSNLGCCSPEEDASDDRGSGIPRGRSSPESSSSSYSARSEATPLPNSTKAPTDAAISLKSFSSHTGGATLKSDKDCSPVNMEQDVLNLHGDMNQSANDRLTLDDDRPLIPCILSKQMTAGDSMPTGKESEVVYKSSIRSEVSNTDTDLKIHNIGGSEISRPIVDHEVQISENYTMSIADDIATHTVNIHVDKELTSPRATLIVEIDRRTSTGAASGESPSPSTHPVGNSSRSTDTCLASREDESPDTDLQSPVPLGDSLLEDASIPLYTTRQLSSDETENSQRFYSLLTSEYQSTSVLNADPSSSDISEFGDESDHENDQALGDHIGDDDIEDDEEARELSDIPPIPVFRMNDAKLTDQEVRFMFGFKARPKTNHESEDDQSDENSNTAGSLDDSEVTYPSRQHRISIELTKEESYVEVYEQEDGFLSGQKVSSNKRGTQARSDGEEDQHVLQRDKSEIKRDVVQQDRAKPSGRQKVKTSHERNTRQCQRMSDGLGHDLLDKAPQSDTDKTSSNFVKRVFHEANSGTCTFPHQRKFEPKLVRPKGSKMTGNTDRLHVDFRITEDVNLHLRRNESQNCSTFRVPSISTPYPCANDATEIKPRANTEGKKKKGFTRQFEKQDLNEECGSQAVSKSYLPEIRTCDVQKPRFGQKETQRRKRMLLLQEQDLLKEEQKLKAQLRAIKSKSQKVSRNASFSSKSFQTVTDAHAKVAPPPGRRGLQSPSTYSASQSEHRSSPRRPIPPCRGSTRLPRAANPRSLIPRRLHPLLDPRKQYSPQDRDVVRNRSQFTAFNTRVSTHFDGTKVRNDN